MWGCTILGTHFKFKKNLEGKLVGDLWALLTYDLWALLTYDLWALLTYDLWALLDFRTPTFFIDDSDAEFHPD